MRSARLFVAVVLVATACGSDREEPGDGGSSATSAQAPAVTSEMADADGQGSSGATDQPPVGASEGSSAVPDGPVPDLPTEPVAPSVAPSSAAPTVVESTVDPSPQVADSEMSQASPPAEPVEPSAAPTPPEPPAPPTPPEPRPTTWPSFIPADLEWEPATILVAREGVNEIIPVYDAPDGNRRTFPDGELWSYTYRRNRLVARVTQGEWGDEWVEAELPIRPNGTRGWIRTDKFNWSTVNHHVFVDVSDRSMAFFDGDELITHTRVIVGKPATYTPTLTGFIVEKLANHEQQYGSVVFGDWILMLSFFSETLNSFGGGLPRTAIRGTHIPERVGEALSNGGVRTPAEPLEIIAQQAPLGTVVRIVE